MKPSNENGQRGSMPLLVSLTLFNVGLQLSSATLLKIAAVQVKPSMAFVTAILGLVLSLNAGRFVIWNTIHKRYPVSLAYPLSALFFPAVVALAWYMGERVGPWQIAGAGLVMAGTAMIVLSGPTTPRGVNLPEPLQ